MATDMLTRYNESNKPRPSQAKQIPTLAVNFFDTTNQFQDGFTTFEKPNDPTKFTAKAMDYFTNEVATMVIPPTFVPLEQGVTLNRWSSKNKYTVPGALGF